MDKPNNARGTTPGYETHDANAGGVFKFLVALGSVLVVTGLVCWGLFRYFSAHDVNQSASDSPFADTRQLPLGPQLQVTPREDWLKYREQQEQSLETYGWENRGSGIVRVPIERAMELLVQKGLPVQNSGGLQVQPAPADTPHAATPHPATQAGKKP